MDDGDGKTPWAYVAHKDGMWAGVAAATQPRDVLRKFLGDFAADGFLIATVCSRKEYLDLIGSMEMWRTTLK